MRPVLIAVGVLGLLCSLWGLSLWPILPPLYAVAFWSLLLLIGLLFEQYRYKDLERQHPGPELQATEESFIDPATGEAVRVFFDPRTGGRRYVAQPGRPFDRGAGRADQDIDARG